MGKSLTAIIICVLLSAGLRAQQIEVRVFDALDSIAVPNTHLVFHEIEGEREYFGLTDADGVFKHDLPYGAIVEASFVGYKAFSDTVFPGQRLMIYLEADPFGLDEVVVTAQYAPESERNSVYKIKVLGEKQIENRAAVNVADLLENQLNIRISQDNATGTTGMSMMGLGGENIKILLDGVPLIGRLNGVIDLNQINLNNIERVEVIEGPVSVSYGSNALGGVINLISKSPESEQVRLNLNSYYESVGQYNFDGLVEVAGPSDALQLSGGRNFFDGFSTTDRNRGDDWNQKEQLFGKALYQRRIDKGRIRLSSDGFFETIKDKGEINAQNLAFDQHYRTTRWVNDLSLNRAPREGVYYEAFFAYSYYERKRNAYVKDMESLISQPSLDPAKHDTSTFHSLASRGNWSHNAFHPYLSAQLGYDINYELGLGERIRDGRQDILDAAIFGSAKWKKGLWVVQPALRIAYNTKYEAPLIPSLNVKYNLREDFFFRFSYARGFRAPSLKELYLDFVDANHNVQGNDELLAERSHSFNLSSVYYFGRKAHMFKLEPALWFNQIEDKIQLVYMGPGPADFTNTNIGSMRSVGGKMQLGWEFHPRVNMSAGYAIMGRTDWTGAADSDQYYITDEWNATLAYVSIPKKWSLTVFYKFTGESPQPVLGDGDELEQRVVPSYQMLDLTFNKRFWGNRIILNAGGKNLFDVTDLTLSNAGGGVHSGGGSLPVAWGRTWFVGLKLNLDHETK